MEKKEFVRQLNTAGIVSNLRGEYDEAIKIYLFLLGIDPAYSSARYNLALAYCKKGMTLHAIEEYLNYLELSPEAQDYWVVFTKIEELRKELLENERPLLENGKSIVNSYQKAGRCN